MRCGNWMIIGGKAKKCRHELEDLLLFLGDDQKGVAEDTQKMCDLLRHLEVQASHYPYHRVIVNEVRP